MEDTELCNSQNNLEINVEHDGASNTNHTPSRVLNSHISDDVLSINEISGEENALNSKSSLNSTTSSSTNIILDEKMHNKSSPKLLESTEKLQSVTNNLSQSKEINEALLNEVIDEINQHFPTSDSLTTDTLNEFILSTRKNIVLLDRNLHKEVRTQMSGMADHSSLQDQIKETQTMTTQLIRNMEHIKEMALESEKKVEHITNDIRSLDHAKKNLTKTITVLRKYYMLGEAVENLRQLSLKPNPVSYEKIANYLGAVNSLLVDFSLKKFSAIESISRMHQTIDSIKNSLFVHLESNFKKFFADYLQEERAAPTEELKQLFRQECNIISQISDSSVQKIIQLFIQYNMKIYEVTVSREASRLESIHKQYSWFKKRLRLIKVRFDAVFPDEWFVKQEFAVDYCLRIRKQIQALLGDRKNTLDAQILHKALLNTIKFERDLHAKFQLQSHVEMYDLIKQKELELEKLNSKVKSLPNNVEVISLKYKILQKEKKLQELKEEQLGNLSDKRKPTVMKNYRFLQFISTCFEEYMDVYIDFEDKNMLKKIQIIIDRETWSPDTDSNSAQDLFIYISESLRNCAAFSNGKVLYTISQQVWKKYTLYYGDSLLQKLAKMKSTNTSKFSFLKEESTNGSNLKESQLATVVHIVRMADYCQEELDQTRDILYKAIEEQYRNKISFSDEKVKFYNVLKSSIEVMVMFLMNSIDSSLQGISKFPWESFNSILEESNYVKQIIPVLREEISYYATCLPSDHYPMLCDNFTITFMDGFLENVLKCKRISNEGAQQLLQDVSQLKKFLRDLYELHPQYNELFDEDDLHAFSKKVNRSATHVELLLKNLLVQSPDNMLVDHYISMMGEFASKKEFSKLLEMKGKSKQDRAVFISMFEEKERIKNLT